MAAVKRLLAKDLVLLSTKHGYEEQFINEHGLDAGRRKVNAYWLAARLAETSVTDSYAISEGLRRFFVEAKLARPERMGLVYYGAEALGEKPVDPALRVGDPQLVLVGRLVRFKGHRFALDALSRLAPKHPTLKLVIVGSGPIEGEIREQVRSLGLEERVVFTGNKPNAREYMRASDIVLVPSLSEGFGLVFLEAFDAGTPVVAFDVPAGREILEHGRSGILVPPYDVAAYADAIDSLLANPAERRRLAEGGRERLGSRFALDRMVAETRGYYEALLRRVRGQGGVHTTA
jgi:glycosyltransferase involved in cell wall biosynthesis